MTTTTEGQFVPINQLGPIAVQALRNLRERQHLDLPKPSRVLVRVDRSGKFTTATVKSGRKIAVGVAAKNPHDREQPTKGTMTALTRALRMLGQ